MTRLVAVDLDGTLLRSDLTVSERSRAAIAAARSAGVDVVVVTARSPRSVREIAREAGLGGLAICANGAMVFDLDRDQIVRHTVLPSATVHRVVRAWRALRPDVAFGWELELRFGSEPAYEAQRDTERWPRPVGSYPPVDVLELAQPVTKLLARAPGVDLDALLAEARRLAAGDASVTRAGDAFAELMAPGVSKRAALAEVAAARGVANDDIAAFGDQITDAGMLEWAGLGVAVANAHPSVLAVADVVTASNDDDGVAMVLERLVERASAHGGSSSD